MCKTTIFSFKALNLLNAGIFIDELKVKNDRDTENTIWIFLAHCLLSIYHSFLLYLCIMTKVFVRLISLNISRISIRFNFFHVDLLYSLHYFFGKKFIVCSQIRKKSVHYSCLLWIAIHLHIKVRKFLAKRKQRRRVRRHARPVKPVG